MKLAAKRRLIVIGGVVILALAALLVFRSFGGKQDSKDLAARRPIVPASQVALTTLQPVAVTEYTETTGTVKAKTVSVLAAKLMGTVTAVQVRQGDRVAAGQLLLTIDADDIYRQLEAARFQKELADVTAERYRRLYDESAVARQQLDEVETRRKVADAEYARAAANMAFSRITAPTAGVVTDRKIDPGSMAAPGQHLLTVEDISAFSIETQADERWAERIAVGMPVEVAIESQGRTVPGKVVERSPSLDSVSHTFYVKVEMADAALKSGLYAKVRFPLGQRKALVAPAESVVAKGQLTGVYVVDDRNTLHYRLVKPGKTTAAGVEILSGLSAGERIVVKGAGLAVDGAALGEVKAP